MVKDYRTAFDANARLVILRALAGEANVSLNDALLLAELERFGILKSKDYLRIQLAWLESEAGAVKLREAGTAIIATLLQPGLDHVERRRVLDGVQRPSLEE
jgi:hypothetical protein